MRNKRKYALFRIQAKKNFRLDLIFRFGAENDGAP